jgi:ATP-binding cassette subfamily F protein uup
MANLVNLENVSLAYGTRTVLDSVSLGVADGDRIGVVGANGGGKSTLLRMITGREPPDSGRVTRTGGVHIGFVDQRGELTAGATVRSAVVGDAEVHEWAGDAAVREVLAGLGLPTVGLDADVARLSGGERRRVALASVLVGRTDLLVLDEPTNHLDIEAITWLAGHLAARPGALLVVTHDRWLLDAVCTRSWEVGDASVRQFDGGYAAYVLARAERARQAGAAEARRQNLLRKELAWLRRGAPARTAKPKFRIDAAEALIADVPEPRSRVELAALAARRLGRSVYELDAVTVTAGDRVLLNQVSWHVGPGDRVAIIGVNGAGKTHLLRLLAGEIEPRSGTVRTGATVHAAHLSQEVAELPAGLRVIEAVEQVRSSAVVGGVEQSATQLAQRFGFAGDKQWTPVSQLSGGERRRLQLLRLLLSQPNVLLLDEPTNDLDVDTLTALEDLLDSWPGTLVIVSHDRYLIERVCDTTVALLGDGSLPALPGGVEDYLARRAALRGSGGADRSRSGLLSDGGTASRSAGSAGPTELSGPAMTRRADPAPPAAERRGSGWAPSGPAGSRRTSSDSRATRRELVRVEREIARLERRESELHQQLIEHATDFEKVVILDAQLRAVVAERTAAEDAWLSLSDD